MFFFYFCFVLFCFYPRLCCSVYNGSLLLLLSLLLLILSLSLLTLLLSLKTYIIIIITTIISIFILLLIVIKLALLLLSLSLASLICKSSLLLLICKFQSFKFSFNQQLFFVHCRKFYLFIVWCIYLRCFYFVS